MSDQISWWVELAVKPGQLENFRALTAEMIEFTRREPGVLSYQRFVGETGKLIHVWERYTGSAAAAAHLVNFVDRFGDRFSTMVDRRRFLVFGQPSNALKQMLDGFGAVYLRSFGDLPYW